MDNKSKSNFTDLANTYLYGKDSWRNFTKKYFNNDQSIDDPIFTGFSMSIDDLTSPLFFTGGVDTGDTLRSTNGGNTELASTIEERLRKVNEVYIKGNPYDYEINTKSVKDVIDSGELYRAGYGLQDRVYMDNVLYGAMEYIYMVDKVVEGNVKDSIGVSDLGNGTPSRSVYDEYNDAYEEAENSARLQATVDKILDDSMAELSEELGLPYDRDERSVDERMEDMSPSDIINYKKEELLTQQQNEKIQKEHNEKTNALLEAEKAYINIAPKNERGEIDLNYLETKRKEYEELCSSEHIQGGKKKFSELKEKVLSKYEALKDAVAKKAEDEYIKIKPKLEEACKEFEDSFGEGTIWDGIKNNVTNLWNGAKDAVIEFTSRDTCDEEKDLSKIVDVFKDAGDVCEKTYKILKKQIKEIKSSESYKDTLDKKKNELDQLAKDLYGVDGMGNPNTPEKAEETGSGKYGAYMKAKKELDNDEFNQLKKQGELLDEAKANYANTMEYNEYESTKQETTFSSPAREVVMDNEGKPIMDDQGNPITTIVHTKNRNTQEVPQTVYDIIGFINGMKKLTTEYPYVMQAVTGLDEAYKTYFFNKDDAYLGSGDNKIVISCYESLDLRVSSMFNKYFNAVYDRQYRRERVPINLRRFNCSIFIHDIRNFRHSLSKRDKFYENPEGDNVLSKIVEVALNSMSVVEFKFFDCEIVPEETGNIFGNVNNEGGNDMLKTNLAFTYGNCVINFLPFGDLEKYYTSQAPRVQPKEEKTGYFKKLFGPADNKDEDVPLSGDFRRWFDKSELGNVNNNDYRDYIRHDSSVAVDDYYKNTISNNFANNSIGRKNQELTNLDDALRRLVIGVSASTGIPAKGVTDALNIKYIDPIINNPPIGVTVNGLGNINDGKNPTNENTNNLGNSNGSIPQPHDVNDLGNIHKK